MFKVYSYIFSYNNSKFKCSAVNIHNTTFLKNYNNDKILTFYSVLKYVLLFQIPQ